MVRTPFLWAVALVLFFALVVQLAMWRDARQEEAEKHSSITDFTPIIQQHRRLRAQIDRTQNRLQRLERATLWGQPHRILPLIGKAANDLPVKLVGVKELAPESSGGYQSFPMYLTFSGDYEGFASLLQAVEGISPPIRIDGVQLYQRRQYPDTLWMGMTVAPMYSEDRETPTEIQMPALSSLRIGRDAFAFGRDKVGPVKPIEAVKDPPVDSPLPKLAGILWNDQEPIAIFTDDRQRPQSAHVGEVIGEAKILDIQPQAVILIRGEEQIELRLWEAVQGFSIH